ncbi:MAG: phosphodiesterase [Betaproteobacteria bacterium]|nr:MAG: phosphodiesterase [Betaproteobacteria bacterium]
MLIAQITDTHIKANGRLAYGRVDTHAALARCVTHVNALRPAPDVVLVTGDLVDTGKAAEYGVLRTLLDRLAMPYYVIPGNHDERSALRNVFADAGYLPRDGQFLHYVIEHFPLRLIGLDSTIPEHPEGQMCSARLAWLDERLREAPERPTLLFMHHPPFVTGIEHMDVQRCGNEAGFGAVVVRHRQVMRLLCGHVHRAIQMSWHGITASIGPSHSHSVALDLRPGGASAFVLEPPAYQLHRWTPHEGLVSHLAFVGTYDGPHPFFEKDGRLID